MKFLNNTFLKYFGIRNIEGPLKLNKAIFDVFLSSVEDPLPDFQRPKHPKLRPRKDHPKYARWVYVFAKYYKPDIIVEVGTYAGGTAVGWAKALAENGKGKLICIDNDTYIAETYPVTAKKNIQAVGLEEHRYELKCGDSKNIVPNLAQELPGKVDMYLVDGDHRYESALADIENGLPLVKSGGFILVHDVDKKRKMAEATGNHPYPVYEAFKKVAGNTGFEWCILRFIRKHLGIIKVASTVHPTDNG